MFFTIRKIVEYGAPSYIFSFGDSLGDNLLITTLTASMRKNGYGNIWIKSDREELFWGNNDIEFVMPFNTTLSTTILKLAGTKVVNLQYSSYDPKTDRDIIPPGHVVQTMARKAGLNINIENKPVVNLSEQEIATGKYFQNQIAIVNSGAGAALHFKNKDWYPDRFQDLVDSLRHKYQFVQLGTKHDTPLNNVLDLRGKTTLRESASVLKSSVLLVSYVGFLMHMARAVDCRSVILYGGRESPEQSGYKCFENIYRSVPCSPCWLRNRCDYSKVCMDLITVDDVKLAVVRNVQLQDVMLPIDILNKTHDKTS